jgi:nitrite reductase/ring-hydroxylating ferredoxin subunit
VSAVPGFSPDSGADGEEFEPVCATGDLNPGRLLGVVLADGSRVCVGNRSGAIFAVSDRCPHQQFPLSDGELTAEGTIVCSWHGAAFDCVTGKSVRGPLRDRGAYEAPLGRVHIYEVRVEGGTVFVRAPRVTF